MGWLERQREMKLDILESLARSQRAMARIIESAADADHAAVSARTGVDDSLRKSIEAIERYQLVIMEKMLGIQLGEIMHSPPSAPWTNEALYVAALYEAPEQEQK